MRLGRNRLGQRLGLKSVPTVYALRLDGISGTVKVLDNATLDITGNLTLGTTIQINTLPALSSIFIAKFDIGGGGNRCYFLEVSNANTSRFSVSSNGVAQTVTDSTNNVVTKIKFSIIGIYNGSNLQIYHQGIADGIPTSYSGTILSSYPDVYMGSFQGTSNFLNCLMFDSFIINGAIPSSNIPGIASGALKPTDIAGCVLYHDYTKGNANDLSGNGNNGALQGNAFFEPQSLFQ